MENLAPINEAGDVPTRQYVDDGLAKKVETKDALFPNNPFGGYGPKYSHLDNALFLATKRWTVTGNFYRKSDDSLVGPVGATPLAYLFDGNYESTLRIPLGQYAVINISFANESGGKFIGYPYGGLFVSHYHYDHTESVSARVYCNHAPQGVGWKTLTFSDVFRTSHALCVKARNDYYAISEMEFTLTAPDTGYEAWVNQIDFFLDRPSSGNEMPFVSKFRAETLYNPLTLHGDPVQPLHAATKQYVDVLTPRASAVELTSVSWNSITAPGTHPYLMHGTQNPNGTGTTYYFYVTVYAYGTTGNLTQIAYPYHNTDQGIFIRYRYSGAWSAWAQHVTTAVGDSRYAASSHAHPTSDVTGLDTALAGKAPTSHTHDDRYFTESEVTSKLAGKADSAHTHPYLPLSGGALDGDLDLTWHSITTVWDVQTSNLTGNPDVVGGDISLNNSLNANGNRIYGVVAPAAGDQAANKGYVDGAAQVHVGTAEPTNPNVLLWIDTGA